MKTRVLFGLAMSGVLSALALLPVSANADSRETARVWVQFAPGAKASVATAVRAAHAEFHYTFDDLNAFVVTVPSVALPGLEENPGILRIEEDVKRYPIDIRKSQSVAPASVNLSTPVAPYGVDMVKARDVWDKDRNGTVDTGAPTGADRTVCIIDSGLYTGHADLTGVTASGYNGNLQWNADGFGHGTHVAGTIAAVQNSLGVVGVTPGTVKLYIVRVFGDDGTWAYSSSLVDAGNRCQAAGANIISMSLGGSRASTLEQQGFDSLYANGILSIAAAGNAGTSANSYPASYNSVVSVAAIDSTKTVASFSQYNSQVELSAPGVGVLSTVPYLDTSTVTVGATTYSGEHIEFSGRGTPAAAALVSGGLCDAQNASWSGKVVLCQRGTNSFYQKVMNVQGSGGTAAVIYNNVAGGFLGTLGSGNSSNIIAVSLSQADGEALLTKVGSSTAVASTFSQPGSGYEYWDGTSMATPHVSAVAALVWSAKPTATNVDVRNALTSTAQDLGAAGRDVYYGFGLVQAPAAITSLTGAGAGATPTTVRIADLDPGKTVTKTKWTATVTATVTNLADGLVSGATVTGSWSGGLTGTGSCTTLAGGTCSITSSAIKLTSASVTFTVTSVSGSGLSYDSSRNGDRNGNSTGTAITIAK